MARAGARSGPLVIAQLCRFPLALFPSCANLFPSLAGAPHLPAFGRCRFFPPENQKAIIPSG
jgi:hypothetical protein